MAINAQHDYSLIDSLTILAKHKKYTLVAPAIVAAFALIVSLFFPDRFIASARILPPQQSLTSTLSAIAQFTNSAPLPLGALGIKNPSDLYVGLLRSRTITDQLIAKFSLQQLYEEDTLVDTRKTLEDVTSITASKDGIILIEVEDNSPTRAAELANTYVQGLDKLLQGLAITEAAQRRKFFENHLRRAKDDLANAEIALMETQQKTGLIKLEDQGRAIIEYVASIRAQIAAKEIQLASSQSFATTAHPDVVRLNQELRELRTQLAKVESQANPLSKPSTNVIVPTGQLPEAAIQYVRRYRDVKYSEAVFEILARQYEQARIEEANNAPLVQIVDTAIAPDKKAKPRRATITLLSFFAFAFLMALWVLVRESMRSESGTPVEKGSLSAIARHLFSWR